MKDEHYPMLDWTTGKTTRVGYADNALGPYPRPGEPISPSTRCPRRSATDA